MPSPVWQQEYFKDRNKEAEFNLGLKLSSWIAPWSILIADSFLKGYLKLEEQNQEKLILVRYIKYRHCNKAFLPLLTGHSKSSGTPHSGEHMEGDWLSEIHQGSSKK